MTTLRQAEYLRALRAGYETGWWDDRGIPAPWPEDFLDPNSGWRGSDEPSPHHDHELQNGDQPPF
jgi:hypothetical protein